MEEVLTQGTEVRTIALSDIVENPENPRSKGGDIVALTASIRQIGLIEPIVVRELTEGLFMVVSGHRRFAALKKLGRHDTQAIVRAFDATSELSSAIAENSVREDLTALELGESMARLSGLGVSDDEITAALGVRAESLAHAKTVSTAKAPAKKAIDKYGAEEPLTLEEAAAVARFTGDKAYGDKIDRALRYNRSSLAHVVAQIEADIVAKAKLDELETLFKGVPKLGKYDNWYGPDLSMEPVANLTNADGKTISSKEHQTCPGNAVEFITDKATPRALIWCTAWAKNGHKKAAKPKVKIRREKRYTASARSTGKPPSDAERAKASAERRTIIFNNKAWTPATSVRQEWLASFSQRKSLTAEAKFWVLSEVVLQPELLPRFSEKTSKSPKAESIDRLFVKLFGLLAKAREAQLAISTWRGGHEKDALKRYFLFIEAQGYVLSDVEGIVAGRKAPVPPAASIAVKKAPAKKTAPKKASAAKKVAKKRAAPRASEAAMAAFDKAEKRSAAVKELVDSGTVITTEDLEAIEDELHCTHEEFMNGACIGCGLTHEDIDGIEED